MYDEFDHPGAISYLAVLGLQKIVVGHMNLLESEKIADGVQFLAENGLNLFAVLDCATLPEVIQESLPEGGFRRLVLLGNGGSAFWQALQRHGMDAVDPVDRFSLLLAQTFIDDYLGEAHSEMVYPSSKHMIPLQQLGTLAGWHHPSPLGIGIHDVYGLWFAYRTAFVTTAVIPRHCSPQNETSPCDTCRDKPCVAACPGGAVASFSAGQAVPSLNLQACIPHRLKTHSSCADRCLSRMACPIGREHQYTLEQINYHYTHSLDNLHRYYKNNA